MNKPALLETRKKLEDLITEKKKELRLLKRKKSATDARIESFQGDTTCENSESSNLGLVEEEDGEENADEVSDEESSIKASQEGPSSCTICMEEWTIGSDHRVCCLRCGHLFGRSCIVRWIKEKGANAKCPTCNKPAKKRDLVDLWCKSISATDDTELCRAQEALSREQNARKTDIAIKFSLEMKVDMLHKGLVSLKKEAAAMKEGILKRDEIISRMRSVINQLNKGQKADDQMEITTLQESVVAEENPTFDADSELQQLKGSFHLKKKVESSQPGGCKSFAVCPTSAICLIAQPAPHNSRNIFGGFGLRKFSTVDTNCKEFIPLHSKLITSIQVKPVGDLVLTSSQDKKVILTSINNNTSIQTYHCQYEPTCVAWSSHRDQQFYVASGNCYVTLYDMRNTTEYIYQTTQRVANTRLLSIASMTGHNQLSGLIVNDARGSQFLEVSETSNYDMSTIDRSEDHLTRYQLPFEGVMGTVDFDSQHDLALISTRRSAFSEFSSHNIVQLQKVQDDLGGNKIECKSMGTFYGGRAQELLSQSRLLKHPTLCDSVLVGAVDDQARGIKLWDSSDNQEYQSIKTEGFVRDMIMYNPENTNMHFLYTLSEKGLSIYQWDYI